MKTVFVDSGGIIAYLNTRDENHVKAKQALQELARSKSVSFVTTDYVFVEVCNTFSGLGFRKKAHTYIESFINSPSCRLLKIDNQLFEMGLQMFRAFDDKEWGLTDCCSFIVMRREDIKDAFTTDKHFEQAGLNQLIK